MIIIIAIILVIVFIWLLPSILVGLVAVGAAITGIVRGTKEGFKTAERPASPRLDAMRASSERMKAERLAKKAARRAKREKK